jgi:hypothetical protein
MTDMAAICDGRFAGVLITDGEGRYLVSGSPSGIAPVCGHVDQHRTHLDAARALILDQAGVSVLAMSLVASGWSADSCRRKPGPAGGGHQWEIWGALACRCPPPREASCTRWADGREMRALAARTVRYASGDISGDEFAAEPGIAPMWMGWLNQLLVITVLAEDLELAGALAASAVPDPRRPARRQPAGLAGHYRRDLVQPLLPSFDHPRGRPAGRAGLAHWPRGRLTGLCGRDQAGRAGSCRAVHTRRHVREPLSPAPRPSDRAAP